VLDSGVAAFSFALWEGTAMVATLLERARKAREDESGFTLIELLIVIVILGILAGIVVFAVGGITDRGQTSACQTTVKTVDTAVEAYYAQNGSYPATVAQLVPGFLHDDPTAANYNANYSIAYSGATTHTASGTLTGSSTNDCK
jgi:general secretion pathway protein G